MPLSNVTKANEGKNEDAYTGLNNHFNALVKQLIDKSGTINNW